LSAQGNRDAKAVLRFIETREALVTSPRVLTPAAAFLQVEGAGSGDIIVEGGDISKAAKPVSLEAGAAQNAVKVRG